jgi:hypothetical protein
MKKKSHPTIPDFSRKRPSGAPPAPSAVSPDALAGMAKAPAPRPERNIKPPSTSAKSGRRGQ